MSFATLDDGLHAVLFSDVYIAVIDPSLLLIPIFDARRAPAMALANDALTYYSYNFGFSLAARTIHGWLITSIEELKSMLSLMQQDGVVQMQPQRNWGKFNDDFLPLLQQWLPEESPKSLPSLIPPPLPRIPLIQTSPPPPPPPPPLQGQDIIRGSAVPIPPEAKQWMERGGLSHLHAQVMRTGLEDARKIPWLSLSSDIDFGIQRTDPAALSLRNEGWSREFQIMNIGSDPVILLSIDCLPHPRQFKLFDDHHISQSSNEVVGVSLLSGQSYSVACCLSVSEPISAICKSHILLTFHTSSGPQIAVRMMVAALTSHSQELEACLRVEAPTFYPLEIRGTFKVAQAKLKSGAEERALLRTRAADELNFTSEQRGVLLPLLEMMSAEEVHVESEVDPFYFLRAKTAVFPHTAPSDQRLTSASTFMIYNWPPFKSWEDSIRRWTWMTPSKEIVEPQPYRGSLIPQEMQLVGESWAVPPYSVPHVLAVFDIPGLVENRPIVLPHDTVLCRLSSVHHGQYEFSCRVATVDSARGKLFLVMPAEYWILLFSHPDFHTVDDPSPLCHLLFTIDQTPSRRLTLAVFRAASKLHLLPCDEDMRTILSTQNMSLFSEPFPQQQIHARSHVEALSQSLKLFGGTPLNAEQRRAIASVLLGAGSNGSLPFCIFGPPGTGKTVTLTECVLQILNLHPKARILVCAPMNFSCDLITHSLAKAKLQPGQVIRLQDLRRRVVESKEEIRPYCFIDQSTNSFILPDASILCKAAVVVSSCFSSGMLAEDSYACQPLLQSFDYVLVDEAGQATVAETLIPATLSSGSVVLVGDPCQLGPVVRCKAARAKGMDVSLLEYLIRRQIGIGAEDDTAMVMLRCNYRSHSDLLELPSRLFYRSALIPCADPRHVQPPIWVENGNSPLNGNNDEDRTRYAMIFYGVRGQQCQQGDVASFFNPIEASVLADQLEDLLYPFKGISPYEVGVICTYRQQVAKIRLILRLRGLSMVNVGTVDDYQGQEERVIFISTVLSKAGSTGGHFSNYKRFNVAITRSKALLVVVGDPIVLVQDPSWKELLRHCACRGTYRGEGKKEVYQALGVHSSGEEGADDHELNLVAEQIAEIALLGYGDAKYVFPSTTDEFEMTLEGDDEVPSRVAL